MVHGWPIEVTGTDGTGSIVLKFEDTVLESAASTTPYQFTYTYSNTVAFHTSNGGSSAIICSPSETSEIANSSTTASFYIYMSCKTSVATCGSNTGVNSDKYDMKLVAGDLARASDGVYTFTKSSTEIDLTDSVGYSTDSWTAISVFEDMIKTNFNLPTKSTKYMICAVFVSADGLIVDDKFVDLGNKGWVQATTIVTSSSFNGFFTTAALGVVLAFFTVNLV
eukprot:CAMPEP_0205813278 /NCGR_PEP_ID=MMETSP0205-20121125/17934_1 /ASSEMBLY_ACC=CAM_ASM_000278 /TAXON_ID=36767 /ORGANISM="Euplotes focardii, Strain TN1" /LENGTH=222 /DNA_ID=CAMNT_0053095201 /DNA_START=57 /DNA_END=725 /DNA_ORIENTATION=-